MYFNGISFSSVQQLQTDYQKRSSRGGAAEEQHRSSSRGGAAEEDHQGAAATRRLQSARRGRGRSGRYEVLNSAMFGLFMKNKPVKIRSVVENTKYGVAAKDVKELIKKGCKLLQVIITVFLLLLLWFVLDRLFRLLFFVDVVNKTKTTATGDWLNMFSVFKHETLVYLIVFTYKQIKDNL